MEVGCASMIKFTNDEWTAIEAFWMSCVIPIIYVTNTEKVWGTGLLFSINKHLCIITAAHVAKDISTKPDNFGIFANKDPKSGFFSFKNCDVFMPKKSSDQDKFDVAIIRINGNEYLCRNLEENYSFLSSSNIANYRHGINSFLITGFPSEEAIIPSMNQQKKGGIGGLFKFQTEEYKGPFSENVERDPSHDIFLSYSDELISNTGVVKEAPELHGISGGPIWGVIQNNSDTKMIWCPENQIKVVGFEVSYMANIWIRGIEWYAVAYTFGTFDVYAKERIHEALNNE